VQQDVSKDFNKDGVVLGAGPAQGSLWQRLKRVAPYFHGNRIGIVAVVLAAALAALTEPAIPALVKALLDRGFGADRGYALWMVPLVVISLFALRGVASFVASYALSWIANRALVVMRGAMFNRLMDGAPDLFTKQTSSQLTNTLVYEAQQGAGLLVQAVLVFVRDSLTILALLAYLMWLNWALTLSVLMLAPAVSFVIRNVSKRLQRLTQDSQRATDGLAYVVEENVLAWKQVRLHDATAEQHRRFDERSHQLRRLAVKSAAAAALSSPLTQIIAAVALSGVMVVALWQGEQGQSTMGSFVAFITSMLMLVSPLKHLSDVTAPLTRGLVALERGLDMVDKHPVEPSGGGRRGGDDGATPDKTNPAQSLTSRARGDITFDHVSLRYADPDAPPALNDVSLRIQGGKVVALVGPSGGGKSSLVNLLPRFILPITGQVTLDGMPLEAWDLRDLRRQFALVSQDVIFFNDSIAANVALGAVVDEARVRQALTDANLMDHVDRMPQGIHSPVGHNASQLSGGQRQRLAIARAIYKDAPILILDEATSALDSHSERAVQVALERLMQGRTTIVIAHRLATIEHADHVVVMDQGRIQEQGPPATLKAQGGLFAQLHAMQFKP
jgi:ATP-binding cassette, subfamily B, bacterial MsbA